MDGREAMVMAGGTPQYFIHRGGIHGGGSVSGASHNHTELNVPPQFYRTFVNSHHGQPSPASIHRNLVRQSFNVDPQPNPHANSSNVVSVGTDSALALPVNEPPVKKKRGRPRKYGPEGKVALGLLPMPGAEQGSSPGSTTPLPKRPKGRPPGSGRKQRLAAMGEWMNSSAGVAFAPHVIKVGSGEDIAAKILDFSQQRARAMCILSGSGSISLVTLRQPSSSGANITFEGCFEILCLSGSYLLDEDSGPRNRTGGVSVSLSSPDGLVIGGSVGMLIASGPVEVVVCSFVYGSNKPIPNPRDKRLLPAPKAEVQDSDPPPNERVFSQQMVPTSNSNFASSSAMALWPNSDMKHLHTDIDLMRG